MGRRGPKPEPASVKLAKGKSGRRPIGVDPSVEEQAKAVASAGQIKPPAWLKTGGLVVWNRLAPRLIAQKLLFQIDAETFARYCKNFARWLDMQKRLDEMGGRVLVRRGRRRSRRSPSFLWPSTCATFTKGEWAGKPFTSSLAGRPGARHRPADLRLEATDGTRRYRRAMSGCRARTARPSSPPASRC
jgi:P27 family predicted phage terminase small subunit